MCEHEHRRTKLPSKNREWCKNLTTSYSSAFLVHLFALAISGLVAICVFGHSGIYVESPVLNFRGHLQTEFNTLNVIVTFRGRGVSDHDVINLNTVYCMYVCIYIVCMYI